MGLHFIGGATAADVEVLGTFMQKAGLGSITLPNGGSHIWVEGANTKVKINGAAH